MGIRDNDCADDCTHCSNQIEQEGVRLIWCTVWAELMLPIDSCDHWAPKVADDKV